jgi:hypothetical protein
LYLSVPRKIMAAMPYCCLLFFVLASRSAQAVAPIRLHLPPPDVSPPPGPPYSPVGLQATITFSRHLDYFFGTLELHFRGTWDKH